MQYSVPITTKTLDVYIVEAKNGSDAAFKVAGLINDGVPPTRSRELNRTIGSAKPLVNDPTTEEVAAS